MTNSDYFHNYAADALAALSAGLASVTWIAELDQILHVFATIGAVLAGVTAAWWHIEKAMCTRRDRLYQRKRQEETLRV